METIQLNEALHQNINKKYKLNVSSSLILRQILIKIMPVL
jgi:hypothetical protein